MILRLPKGKLERLNLTLEPEGFPDSGPITGIRRHWESRRKPDGGLPARADLDMTDLREWLGYITLVDVEGRPPAFRWRLVGTRIAQQFGRDVTGKSFEEVYDGAILEAYLRQFAIPVLSGEPACFSGDLEYVGREFRTFKCIHLPLASNGRDVDMLMLLVDFDD